ncbi:hypothetical protein V6N13_109836 [Hibiscus sabdariffa]|uniref:Uncharacterized protein n=1 Tax=Hibiscus sabdariffa TaxID=183260 RepID=A0ABR2FQP6_9ROSI
MLISNSAFHLNKSEWSNFSRPGGSRVDEQIEDDYKATENAATLSPPQDSCEKIGAFLPRADYPSSGKRCNGDTQNQERFVGNLSNVGYVSLSRPNRVETLSDAGGASPNRQAAKGVPSAGNSLHEVNIIDATESLSSSGRSISIEPALDQVSVLFSIKPKVWKHPRSDGKFTFKSKVERMQSWVNFSAMTKNKSNQLKERKKRPDVAGTGMGASLPEDNLQVECVEDEVRASQN